MRIQRIGQLDDILDSYKWPLPFSVHLKNWFRGHPETGSRDRKELRMLAYAWFRLGRLFSSLPTERSLSIAMSVLHGMESVFDEKTPELAQIACAGNFMERVSVARHHFPEITAVKVFPFFGQLSPAIKNESFALSYLNQPGVWLHVRRKYINKVEEEINQKGFVFRKQEEQSWAFPPETPLDSLTSVQKGWARIQDLSSQRACMHFHPHEDEKWWDACAGAGGKSLGLVELEPSVNLYASDVRESILQNLRERHTAQGTHQLRTFTADLSNPLEVSHISFLPAFDGIIADVPCSGSGTWARNPENLVYFPLDKIEEYHRRQLSILNNAFPLLKPGKPLIYITCSVFRRENEGVIEIFRKQNHAEIETMIYLEGYREGAENMFLCRLKKLA